MSEKQFTFIKDTVAPNIKTPIVFNNETMSIGEVLSKLNKLNNENKNLKQALWEAEEEYLYEAYHDNPIRLQDKIINLKEDWDKEYWNDRLFTLFD